jgi:hypothetical protein
VFSVRDCTAMTSRLMRGDSLLFAVVYEQCLLKNNGWNLSPATHLWWPINLVARATTSRLVQRWFSNKSRGLLKSFCSLRPNRCSANALRNVVRTLAFRGFSQSHYWNARSRLLPSESSSTQCPWSFYNFIWRSVQLVRLERHSLITQESVEPAMWEL